MNVVDLADAVDPKQFGGKAANLAKLIKANLPVPPGLAVGLGAFTDKGTLRDTAKRKLKDGITPDGLYAVRSSALAEDAEGASWAGQFETFLNIKAEDVAGKVEECHNSAKKRAEAYAQDKDIDGFNIAVVVQKMLEPEIAGVLFTQDPISGLNKFVTEYVEGLGEELVSGRADPRQISWSPEETVEAPFDIAELTKLAKKVEKVFGSPQDIEWVWKDRKIWLVQARPITATQETEANHYLGTPEDLFYWGPSRAQPLYMSDFMAAVENFFTQLSGDETMPNPPRTLVLFHEGKMVWLNKASAFSDFVERLFEIYETQSRLEHDISHWKAAGRKLAQVHNEAFKKQLLRAWEHTLFAEFSLYGAEAVIARRLERFDPKVRQQIWGAFTTPDDGTFLNRIDEELLAIQDPAVLTDKYPWIQDGYEGLKTDAKDYFSRRLAMLRDEQDSQKEPVKKNRSAIARRLGLTPGEVKTLDLVRGLAEFMDDRKAWMMQTRRLITQPLSEITDGWLFIRGGSVKIDETYTHELWERYVTFKSSQSAVAGIVASNGGRHFVNGEVAVVSSPTDVVASGKVLVVPSTSPSYVPLMRQAKALVTDHGGMMSHAAIVAREFNLPCIVGTKQATKVLKSGDNVVLDLVKGEVSK